MPKGREIRGFIRGLKKWDKCRTKAGNQSTTWTQGFYKVKCGTSCFWLAPCSGGTRLSCPCHKPMSHSFQFTPCSIGLTTNGRLVCTQELVQTDMGTSPVLLWGSKELTASRDAAVCSVNVGLHKHKAFYWDSGSQNHLCWKRPLGSSITTVNLTLPSPPLNQVTKCLSRQPVF